MKAVIFDLDGTLANTLDDIADAMNHVLAERGLPTHAVDDYRHMVGWGVPALVEKALPAGFEGERGDPDDLIDAFRARYGAHAFDRSAPYPGIPAMLDALVARGTPMGILSNKPDEFTKEMVSRLFGRWSFGAVAGARPDVPRKPDPAAARDIAARLGATPGDCVFVGDSDVDMRTANNAGMRAVGVDWGFRDREELEGAGSEVVLERPMDLLSLLDAP